ncbi:hypothetical protein [Brevundimonas sp. NIBR11]|uniref:terminase small subunit-like protein n=1 Tax=Brevundimonas sp. NIBR11 TaxID=3015999 RepID=UPI0022F05E0E|nr:hypothetical protein [Brevundimonas sp. NIBR11]WGM31485.1 hypothetical protein KKHFBJBL_01732 [Brevundimonas sp. NIBR11]
MARPSLFSEAVADEICIRIMCGDSLAEVCRDEEMPAYRTVMRWLKDNEPFRRNYASAREDQGHADADEIGDIARRILKGEVDPAAGRAAIDALKWTAGKRMPKVYGDKMALVGGGKDDAPISHSHAFDLKDASDEELEVIERFVRRRAADAGRDQGGTGEAEG